jgi:hypothetical protein
VFYEGVIGYDGQGDQWDDEGDIGKLPTELGQAAND